MTYPKGADLKELTQQIELYAQLKAEYGAEGISEILSDTRKALRSSLSQLRNLPIDRDLAKREPNDLRRIQALRPEGPRRLWKRFEKDAYLDRLEGALLGRMAGCTLGAPVEFWPIEKMKALAEENGDAFPPTDYWCYVREPKSKRYEVCRREEYT